LAQPLLFSVISSNLKRRSEIDEKHQQGKRKGEQAWAGSTCGATPHTNKTIQVDSSVIMRKRFEDASKWGMVVRFSNLSEKDRDEVHQFVAQAARAPKPPSQSKYLRTPIGQAILSYFNLKKLFD